MGETRTHFSQSRHDLIFKWFALLFKLFKDEFVKTFFWQVIATENIEELICDQRLAVQFVDFETFEMTHAQGSLNLVFKFVNYPRRQS